MSTVLVRAVRSGFAESAHRGSVVTVDPDGVRLLALGVVDAPMFPRSSLKPLQVVGMLRCGLSLPPADLALAASSHSGEDRHVRRVGALLREAGLTESDLACPASLPQSEAAAQALVRAGGEPAPAFMNCSGKHTAMLLTCRAAGWPTAGYLAADHPLQLALRAAVEDLTGDSVGAVGVDGCGAPVFAVSLAGLARAFSRLVLAPPGSPERAVADGMRAFPELVGGAGRDVTLLMEGVPGVLAKDGAEGVYAAATGAGAATALKIDDGANRARMPVLVRELRRLGASGPALDTLAEVPVLGGGRPVGRLQVAY